MAKRLHPAILAALLFLLACLFAGCSQQPVTQMTVDEGFSGKRVMACSPSGGKLDAITGGEEALDALLRTSCPQGLTWEKSGEGSGAVYSFTLSFSSEKEYREKAEALLGREPYLLFAKPSGVFAQGVRLEEDFTSGDLMAWLDQALVDQQLCGQKPGLFVKGDSQVTVDGQLYPSRSRIDIRDFSYLPVNKVSVSTRLLEDDSFVRSVAISIPQSTCHKLGDILEPYMRQRVPEGGTGTWSADAAGNTFTIAFSAANSGALARKTAQALDSASSQSAAEQQQDALFNSQVLFTEQLSFASFPSNKNGKTYVEYRFSSESTSGVSKAQLYRSGRWLDVDGYLDSDGFLFQEDSSLMQVRLQSQNAFSLDSVSVELRRLSEGAFRREVLLDFSGGTGEKGARTASRYFTELGLEGLTAYAEGSRCTLSFQGTSSELTGSLQALFGPENEISLGEEQGFTLYHSALVYDKMDMQSFLQQIGYSGPVFYTYIGNGPVSFLNQEENQSSQSVRVDPNTVTQQLSADGTATLTAAVRWANPWFVLMLCGAALLFLAAVGFIFFFIRRHSERRRGKERVCLPGEFPLSKKCCDSCGVRLYEGMLFCTKCGNPISWTGESKPKRNKRQGGAPS